MHKGIYLSIVLLENMYTSDNIFLNKKLSFLLNQRPEYNYFW